MATLKESILSKEVRVALSENGTVDVQVCSIFPIELTVPINSKIRGAVSLINPLTGFH